MKYNLKKLTAYSAGFLGLVMAFALSFGKGNVQASGKSETLAVATQTYGEVFFVRAGKTEKVRPKTIFYQSDEVFTKKGVVDLQIGPNAVLRLSNFSHLNMKNLTEIGNSTQIELQLKQGTLYSKIVKNLDKNSKYLVSSPTAVAGVRGTEFILTDNSNNSEKGKKFEDSDISDGIHVNDGLVAVKKRNSEEDDENLYDDQQDDSGPDKNKAPDKNKTPDKNKADDLKKNLILKKGESAVIKKGEDLKKDILEKHMQQKMAIFAKLSAMKESNYKLLKEQKDRNKEMIDKIRQKQEELKDKMKK